jgi:7-keto-8-aminopelargonate synthetase-like enzyme
VICDETETILYIDDAHGIGILGNNGGGVAEHFKLDLDRVIVTGTLQKGLGAFGGFIAGQKTLIDFLRVTARSYIFSGTLQPQAVEGALAAIEISRADEGRALRSRLTHLSSLVRNELTELGFQVNPGTSPIVSVLIGPELKTLLAGRKLFDEGLYINSVVYPATPKNEGLLRISINANHTDDEIKALLSGFSRLREYLHEYRDPLGPNLDYFMEFTQRQIGPKLSRIRDRTQTWHEKIVRSIGIQTP